MKPVVPFCMLMLLFGGCADDDGRPREPLAEEHLRFDASRAGNKDSGADRDGAADSGYVIEIAADTGAAAEGGDPSLAELEACDHGDCRAEPVCDGSEGIRLAYSVGGGGPVMNDYGFRYPYGYTFLVIDGSCHYYASVDAEEGTVEGKLSEAEAMRLSQDMQIGKLARWNGSYENCPDGSTTRILTATVQIGVSCHRDAAPAAAAEVMSRAQRWLTELSQHGAALTGPLRVLAKRAYGLSASTPLHEWPVAQPLAAIAGLVFVPSYEAQTPSGALFEGADAPALRGLRARANAALKEARAKGDHPPSPVVKDGASGEAYLLYLRDELPPAQDKAFRRFLKWRR